MRTALSMLLGALLVTGCIFPSFDDMQGSKNDVPSIEAQPTGVMNADAGGAAPDSSAITQPSPSPDPSPDAAADAAVVAKSPGAGKIACGAALCPVAANSHCCAGYVNPEFYCSSPSHTIGWCTGGGGRALFCDEKADCPASQVCCEKGDTTTCSSSCDGGKVLQ